MNDDRSLTLLRAANPVASPGRGASNTPESDAVLERIVNQHVEPDATGSRPHRGRRLALGMALTAAALAIVAFPTSQLLGGLLPDGGTAQAATPDPLRVAHAPRQLGAAATLREIAKRVEGRPNDVGSGSGVEINYRTWSLFTRIDDVDVRSRVVEEEITRVLDADGTGTLTTSLIEDDGSQRERTTKVREDPVEELPDSLTPMRAVLDERNPSSAAGRFNAVVETLLERPAKPASRAAILRYLAATPKVASVGETEDRLGRTGIGLTVQSDASGLPTRYLLVIDPRTGTVLGYEEMLTRDAGRLEVPIPSVIQYIVWENSRYINGSR